MLFVLSLVPALKQQFNEPINGKSQTNRDQKLSLLFLQRHDQSQKFRIYIYYIGYITIKKIGDCENPLYLLVNYGSAYIEEKIEINT